MHGETRGIVATVVVVAVVGAVAGPGAAAVDGSDTHRQEDVARLVVDADGTAEYESIQAAVDDASAGDTIAVRPGTYDEQLRIDVTVTVVAPDGATLDGEGLPGESTAVTIPAGSDAAPTIEGVTITNYYDGVNASDTDGAWTLRNVSIEGNRNDAVIANRAGNAWAILNATLRNNGDEGIEAENTTGDWTIGDTAIVDNDDDGIDADGADATGDWILRNVSLRRNGADALDFDATRGDWTITDSVISESRIGLQVINGRGDWTVRDTVVRNITGYGVYAPDNDGNWTIDRSSLRYTVISAVYAPRNHGAWSVRNTTVRDANIGVFANATTGDWTISHTTIRDTTVPEFDLVGEGTGVYAVDSTGNWTVTRSRLASHPSHAINATGSDRPGNASHNWWGTANGPGDGDCVGNVDCGDALSSRPAVADPPTADGEFESAKTPDDGSRFGTISYAIVATLFVVLVGLLVSVRRYT